MKRVFLKSNPEKSIDLSLISCIYVSLFVCTFSETFERIFWNNIIYLQIKKHFIIIHQSWKMVPTNLSVYDGDSIEQYFGFLYHQIDIFVQFYVDDTQFLCCWCFCLFSISFFNDFRECPDGVSTEKHFKLKFWKVEHWK